MTVNKWKQCNYVNRHVYTRHACHGFHYILYKSKHFHDKAEAGCVCKKCGEKMVTYHYLKCKINDVSLHLAAKAEEEK
jgi:hypothetical protein